MAFQVGDLTDPRDGDPAFDNLTNARSHALYNAPADDYPYGIWDKRTGDLLEIVFQGSIWVD